jgi:hypothetical protein
MEELVARLRIDRCSASVVIGNRSKFYEQSTVFNFQNDKSKISIGADVHIRGELLLFAYGRARRLSLVIMF